MTCIIIEDQPPAQRILKKYIEDLGSLSLKGTFSDGIQALDFLKFDSVDLIFLDIHLPKISGLDFLRSLKRAPHIILTTAFSEYALESYEFAVVDYLLKPFSFQRFVKAIAKVTIDAKGNDSRRAEIFIKSGYEHVKIRLDDIQYIKSDADYTEIIVAGKKHLSSEPLRYWLERLDEDQFVQTHKSYIINATKIEKITGNQISLMVGVVVPIGRTYKESFVNKFMK
jgi:DNA-binding LytR/AlgR family response regulator